MGSQTTGQKKRPNGSIWFRNTALKYWAKLMGRRLFWIQRAKSSSSTEQNERETQNVSSAEDSDEVKPSANFHIVGLKKNDIAEETVHYNQDNHVIEKPKMKTPKSKKIRRKLSSTLWFENPYTQNFGWSETATFEKNVWRVSRKVELPMNFLQFLGKSPKDSVCCLQVTKLWSLPEAVKRQLVDELHFGHPGSTKMLTESNIFQWSGRRKEIENKSSKCTACMSSGKNLKYQLPLMEKIKLLVLTEPATEIQNDFSGKLRNKRVIGEPCIFMGIDRYSKWLVVWICKSTETKEVKTF